MTPSQRVTTPRPALPRSRGRSPRRRTWRPRRRAAPRAVPPTRRQPARAGRGASAQQPQLTDVLLPGALPRSSVAPRPRWQASTRLHPLPRGCARRPAAGTSACLTDCCGSYLRLRRLHGGARAVQVLAHERSAGKRLGEPCARAGQPALRRLQGSAVSAFPVLTEAARAADCAPAQHGAPAALCRWSRPVVPGRRHPRRLLLTHSQRLPAAPRTRCSAGLWLKLLAHPSGLPVPHTEKT